MKGDESTATKRLRTPTRCPRCGRLATRITHLHDHSVATCLDGHDWDPFAKRPAPAPSNLTDDSAMGRDDIGFGYWQARRVLADLLADVRAYLAPSSSPHPLRRDPERTDG